MAAACREEGLRQLLASFQRPALHAKTLGFQHPETGEEVDFDSELPSDFVALLDALEAL
jgi:23S rRNA pseudouridine1911/1915/1917 synthase